jgi:hypothetical protein
MQLPVVRGRGHLRAQRLRQLLAGADVELLVGVRQVHLDGPDRYEQRLSDFAVASAVGGQAGDAQLLGRERVYAMPRGVAGPCSGRGQLLSTALSERAGAGTLG